MKKTISAMFLFYFLTYFLMAPSARATAMAISEAELELGAGKYVISVPEGVIVTPSSHVPDRFTYSNKSAGGSFAYTDGVFTEYTKANATSGAGDVSEASTVTNVWNFAYLTGGESGTGSVTLSIPYSSSILFSVLERDELNGQAIGSSGVWGRLDLIYYWGSGVQVVDGQMMSTMGSFYGQRADPPDAFINLYSDFRVVGKEEGVESYHEEVSKDGTVTFTMPYYIVPGGVGWLRLDYQVGAHSSAFVPEPSTMLLLGSGLVGLIGFRRKFKK